MKLDRRGFLQWTMVGSAGLLVPAACGGGRQSDAGAPPPTPSPNPQPSGPPPAAPAPAEPLPPTESCALTEKNIEGPFFTPGAPKRSRLAEVSMPGTPLQLSGRVLSPDCLAIAGAHMEIWQADHSGAYDLKGFRLRGHLALGDHGVWGVQTIIPGRYLNGPQYRPAHIHVKVAAPGYRPLTTQLYFEGDPYNDADPWIHHSLIMKLERRANGLAVARFDFVLPRA